VAFAYGSDGPPPKLFGPVAVVENMQPSRRSSGSRRRAVRGLFALAVVLATASAASAGSTGYGGFQIRIDPEGLSPVVVQLPASHAIPFWVNYDSVPHTLTFEDSRCTITIPAGERAAAPCHNMLLEAGAYRYRVSDTFEAQGAVVVLPNERRVTMVSSRATIRAGQAVTFSGTVFAASVAPFGGFILQQHAITIFRRGEGSRRFLPIRRVLPMDRPSPCYCDPNEKLWSVTIRGEERDLALNQWRAFAYAPGSRPDFPTALRGYGADGSLIEELITPA